MTCVNKAAYYHLEAKRAEKKDTGTKRHTGLSAFKLYWLQSYGTMTVSMKGIHFGLTCKISGAQMPPRNKDDGI